MVLEFHVPIKGNLIYLMETVMVPITRNVTRNIVRFCLRSS